jgi:transposase
MDDGDIFEHVAVSPVGAGVQRLDVIGSGTGRRRWTREAKARIITESMVPGANVAEVARRNDMQPQHLYLWRRTALERMASQAGRHDQPAFVPMEIEGRGLSPACQSVPDRNADCPEISIDLCGVRLRVPDGVSADHIGRVLSAVRSVS